MGDVVGSAEIRRRPMKFLAIIEVDPGKLMFTLDRNTVIDATCIPGGITLQMMQDMPLMVVNPAKATEDIKILWAKHERATP